MYIYENTTYGMYFHLSSLPAILFLYVDILSRRYSWFHRHIQSDQANGSCKNQPGKHLPKLPRPLYRDKRQSVDRLEAFCRILKLYGLSKCRTLGKLVLRLLRNCKNLKNKTKKCKYKNNLYFSVLKYAITLIYHRQYENLEIVLLI